jgi:hypothetical protein
LFLFCSLSSDLISTTLLLPISSFFLASTIISMLLHHNFHRLFYMQGQCCHRHMWWIVPRT